MVAVLLQRQCWYVNVSSRLKPHSHIQHKYIMTGKELFVIASTMRLLLRSKADDRRTIKSPDFIARFYQPIFSAKLEPSSTAKFIADNIGR